MSSSCAASKKRKRAVSEPSTERLRDLVDLAFDRTQIDELVKQYTPTASGSGHDTSEIVCCPRVYEESYLREPIGSERQCGRDHDCEGLKVHGTTPFMIREFLYPDASPQDARALCLLCRRHEISLAYYRYETGHSSPCDGLRISSHYNLVGVPGEYDVRDCIVSGGQYTGLPLPVVLHVRSAYTCHTKDGVKHLVQSRMRYPGVEDADDEGPFLMRRAALVRPVALSGDTLKVE